MDLLLHENKTKSIKAQFSLKSTLKLKELKPIKIKNFKELDHKLNSMLNMRNAKGVFNLANLTSKNEAAFKSKLMPFESEGL